MDDEMTWVAERLVYEFPEVPSMVVIDTLCRCLDECASASPYFLEHAARARLRSGGHPSSTIPFQQSSP